MDYLVIVSDLAAAAQDDAPAIPVQLKRRILGKYMARGWRLTGNAGNAAKLRQRRSIERLIRMRQRSHRESGVAESS